MVCYEVSYYDNARYGESTMRTWFLSFALSTLILAPACGGGPSPTESCNQVDDIVCKRTLECNSAEDLMRAGISSAADCVGVRVNARDGLQCTDFTEHTSNCDSGETYNAQQAADCATLIADLPCAEFLAGPEGACDLICEAAQ